MQGTLHPRRWKALSTRRHLPHMRHPVKVALHLRAHPQLTAVLPGSLRYAEAKLLITIDII